MQDTKRNSARGLAFYSWLVLSSKGGHSTVPRLPHAEEAWPARVWGCEPHAFRVLKKSSFLQIQSEVHGSC